MWRWIRCLWIWQFWKSPRKGPNVQTGWGFDTWVIAPRASASVAIGRDASMKLPRQQLGLWFGRCRLALNATSRTPYVWRSGVGIMQSVAQFGNSAIKPLSELHNLAGQIPVRTRLVGP